MKKPIILSVMIAVLLLGISTNSFAQKKKRTRKEKPSVPVMISTLSIGECSPIDKLAVVKISENGDLLLGSSKIEKADLTKIVNNYICDKLPSDRVIYIEANTETLYSQIIEVIKLGRRAVVDDFGLQISGEINSDSVSSANKIKVPEEETPPTKLTKAPPLSLVVSLDSEGTLKLNSKPETVSSLTQKLQKVFLTRKQKRIYISGGDEVEKTVFVYASGTVKFGDVIKIIKVIENAGAYPIGLDVDNYNEKIVF